MAYQSNSSDPSSFKPRADFPKMSINKAGNFLKSKGVLVGLGIAVVIAVIWFIYSYIDTRNQLAKLSDPNASQKVQSDELTKTISQYLQLPDETPTVASVNDAAKLKSQEFFKNAQNGDKVLIFSQSGRALLYRPSTKKVIEYSKVDLNSTPTP